MRFLGALLAAMACVGAGLLSARQLQARLRALESWERALAQMRCALETGGAALPEMLEAGAVQGPEALKALKMLLATAPAQSPQALLDRLPPNPHLTAAEEASLRQCLSALFAPVPAAQTQALRYAQAKWTLFCQAARERQQKNGRLFQQLGWLAGAAVFILLC